MALNKKHPGFWSLVVVYYLIAMKIIFFSCLKLLITLLIKCGIFTLPRDFTLSKFSHWLICLIWIKVSTICTNCIHFKRIETQRKAVSIWGTNTPEVSSSLKFVWNLKKFSGDYYTIIELRLVVFWGFIDWGPF